MSNTAAFPSDDRAWPKGAYGLSVAGAVVALAGSAALVAAADSVAQAAGLLVMFLVLTGLEAAVFLNALRPWLEGRTVPVRTRLVQVGLLLLTLLSFAADPAVGAAAACGFLTGVSAPTAWAIRHARINRGLARETQTELRTEVVEEETAEPVVDISPRRVTARRTPRVGPALREALTESTGRLLAWSAATVVTVVGCAATVGSDKVVVRVAFVGACVVVWVVLETTAVWIAVRDFERAATVPKRRYVVLVKDPSPRATRPLLGVWTTEPQPQDGRLPQADAVYQCDSTRRALISSPGALVVHEAWVATGARSLSTPRWVVADAGVALPKRRTLLGRRLLGSVIEAERAGRARPLTMRAPHPNTERTSATAQVIMEEERAAGRWFRVFAWRLAVMVAVAVLFTLLNR